LLGDDLLAIFGSQLGEHFGEVGVGCEDWCASWDLVNNVDDGGFCRAVFFEERGDCFAR
jgi:hypothetical protein